MERYICILLSMIILGSLSFIYPDEASGEDQEYGKAIVIVSSCKGENAYEINKAITFVEYLFEEGYGEDDIDLISVGDSDLIDSIDLISNINASFQKLIDDPNEEKEIVIYISDNGHAENGNPSLQFRDGNISGTQFDRWFENITCSGFTFIIGGNRSGIIGPDVEGPSRTIMSSMAEDEVFFPDEFNITRSLRDPGSDENNDGEITFVEAFHNEERLVEYQSPQIWI